jgi:hypothetical protein
MSKRYAIGLFFFFIQSLKSIFAVWEKTPL